MPKYQLIFNHGESGHSYRYVDATKEEAPVAACNEALKVLKRGYENQGLFRQFNPQRTINVVEQQDRGEGKFPRWENKRGGHKFKIRLCNMSLTLLSGETKKEMWYEPVEEVTPNS